MAPGDTSRGTEDAPGPPEHPGIDAWALCREFVERIVSDAQAAAARDNPGHPVPEVDWEPIWRAGDGAASDESAIGRILRAAWGAAHEIALGTPELLSPPARADRVDGEAGPETAGTSQPPAGDHPAALVEPAPVLMGPVAAPTEPVTAPVVQATSAVEPVTLDGRDAGATTVVGPAEPTDPVTAPLVLTTATVDSVTLDRPEPQATTLVDAAEPAELLSAPTVLGGVDDEGVATELVTRTHSGWATVFTWIRNLGAIMLLFVVWQLWGTAISQHHAQSQLQAAFEASLRAHHPPKPTASGPSLLPASAVVPPPPDGSVVAHLQIPAIGVDQYVVAGTTSTDLAKGPGHYLGSALPGQAGNVAIAGHRTTHGAPFNGLGHLVRGDRIILTTLSGQHLQYVVSGAPQTVSPNDVAVLNYFADNRITLTTCTPEYSAAQRLIVVGELKQPVNTPEPPAQHISYHIVNPATSSWNWSLLPAVGLEVCLLALLGLSYRRFDVWFGTSGKWFILVPLWAAGLYLLFDSLTKFLPETI